MTDPGNLAEYFGFTETEVQKLCEKYEMNFEEARAWYNGYHLISHEGGTRKVYSMYSPKSVVEAMQKRKFEHTESDRDLRSSESIHSNEYGWVKRCNCSDAGGK